jgi:DNA-binding protein YbaB
VDLHELDNDKPHVFKTHDFGKTWTSITKGLPASDPARVVRENPNRPGFLVAGTDTGLFYSDNDGEEWRPLKSNFPTAPIYDLKFVNKTHDLVVGTHGRGVFVFDNLTALEELTPQTASGDFHLFSVQTAHRWHLWNKRGFSQAGFSAPDAPRGAVIDYFLKSEIEVTPEMKEKQQTPVKIVVTDTDGKWVKTFYGPSKPGFNRATWDLRHQQPVRLSFLPPPEPNMFFETNLGPSVVPGTYKVSVTVNGKTESQTVEVAADPRFPADMEAFREQTRRALEVRDQLSDLTEALNRLDSLNSQIGVMKKLLAADETSGRMVPAGFAPVLEQARALEKKVKALQERAYNVESQGPDAKDYIRFTQKLHDQYQNLLRGIMMDYDRAPSPLLVEEHATLYKQLEAFLQDFNGLLNTDVTGFNKLAAENGAGSLFTGAPIQLAGEPAKSRGE